jgi:hypothetical protein
MQRVYVVYSVSRLPYAPTNPSELVDPCNRVLCAFEDHLSVGLFSHRIYMGYCG